jgi:chemotaxis protein methyltransferase CheR
VDEHVKHGLDDTQYLEIAARVTQRSGMVFAPNRRVEARAGIARAMKAAATPGGDAYLALVQRSSDALDDLVDELTVGETHFMRDPAQMELIRRDLLPGLRGRPLAPRVWSAGCATGEEPYSLAILLEQEGLDTGAVVLGTDLSESALGKARTASYTDWSMREVDEAFLQAYFRRSRRRRVLVDRIREKVRFERLNLVGEDSYIAAGAVAMDLILCRNVLIYFDHATTRRIAARLYESLTEGGVLLTGGSDPLLTDGGLFDVEVTRVGLVYRRRPRGAAGAPVRPPLSVPVARPIFREAQSEAVAEVASVHETVAAAVSASTYPELARQAFADVLEQANGMGADAAEGTIQAELLLHPLDAPLHYLAATLLLSLDRHDDAEREAQRSLYLDRTLAVAHFLLGTLQRARGDRAGALRAFRNVRDLCAARPADEIVPAGGGTRSSALQSAAVAEIESLEPSER